MLVGSWKLLPMPPASNRVVGDLGTELHIVLQTLHTRQVSIRRRCGRFVTVAPRMALWTSRRGIGTEIALRVAVSVNAAVHEQ